MNETPQQYKDRLLSYTAGSEPMKIQAASAAKIHKLIQKAQPARLARRPTPEKWSVNEIVAHLADAEIVIGYRMRMILGEPGTPVQAFDQDKWAANMDYAERPAKGSLAAFRALRENNLALLKKLRSEQWEQWGMHSERGQETIRHIVRMVAGHDVNHIRQIEAILRPEKR